MRRVRWIPVAAALLTAIAGITAQAGSTSLTSKAAAQTVVSLTGLAAPTTTAVVTPGTMMSTYGHLRVYDATGKAMPLSNQYVYVETRSLSTPGATYTAISTGRTTATGYYWANWRVNADVDVRVTFRGSATVPPKTTYLRPVLPRPLPTWLDGTFGPTSPTATIRVNTKMSAFGHLRGMYTTGEVGPYAGQRVEVAIREAVEQTLSGPPFGTVAEVVTTRTGYFYTNWTPNRPDLRNMDVAVRLIYRPGYTTVALSYLDLGVIHLQ